VIVFRPLARSDLPTLQRWLNTPHVYEWWGRQAGPGALGGAGPDAATAEQVDAKYGATIDHGGATHRFIMEHQSSSIGLIQWYRLSDYADYSRAIGEDPARAASLDLFIGESFALGRGFGTQAIESLVTSQIFRERDIDRVVAGPAATNARSIRVFAKAGFKPVRVVTLADEPLPEAILIRHKVQP
jgi:aminoglycoside 6'-N-acetyltransferase